MTGGKDAVLSAAVGAAFAVPLIVYMRHNKQYNGYAYAILMAAFALGALAGYVLSEEVPVTSWIVRAMLVMALGVVFTFMAFVKFEPTLFQKYAIPIATLLFGLGALQQHMSFDFN